MAKDRWAWLRGFEKEDEVKTEILYFLSMFGEGHRPGYVLVAMVLSPLGDGEVLKLFEKKYGKQVRGKGFSLRNYDAHATEWVREARKKNGKHLKTGVVYELNGINLPRHKRKGII